jgi:hypothetical protein
MRMEESLLTHPFGLEVFHEPALTMAQSLVLRTFKGRDIPPVVPASISSTSESNVLCLSFSLQIVSSQPNVPVTHPSPST